MTTLADANVEAAPARGNVSRVDLLHALALAKIDWFELPSAGGAGFQWRPEVQERRFSAGDSVVDVSPQRFIAETTERPPLQMPDCWSVTQIENIDADAEPAETLTPTAPVTPLPLATPQQSREAARQFMTSGARAAWPQLRGSLQRALCPARVARRRPVDWSRVSRRSAELRPLLPLPRRQMRRWPANLVLALDRNSPSLAPFVDDMDWLADKLCRLVGHRAVDVRVLGNDPAASYAKWSPDQIQPAAGRWQALHGDALVLISDVGHGAKPRQQLFDAWLRQLAHGGTEITVLGLGPITRASVPAAAQLQSWFAGQKPTAEQREVEQLLSLVAAVGFASDGLLRALAQVVRPGAPPLDLIWAAWNHPDVVAGHRLLWLEPSKSAHYERVLSWLDLDQLVAAAERIRQLNAQVDQNTRHLSALRFGQLAPQTLQDPHCAAAHAAAERYLTHELPVQRQSSESDQATWEQKIKRLISLAHPLVHQRYRRSFARLAQLSEAWRGESNGDAAEWKLIRAGDSLRLLRNDQPWSGAVLADDIRAASNSVVRIRQGDALRWRGLDAADVELFDLSSPSTDLVLELDSVRIWLSRTQRPSWANGWRYDRSGICVKFFSPWGSEVSLSWPNRERNVSSSFGFDEYGLYLDLRIEKATQRLRWIEPGEFLMGSPDDEIDRLPGEGPQHRVQISEGFWLADSACTQAFWRAVVGGRNPGHFSDDMRKPVEQVSWVDVQFFLKRLQQRLPSGSEPVLPTEAQWEFACRAGTQTTFNLGMNITTDQVNYDGSYPYANAAMGECRGRTVPVKSLPPNRWGLYEMHGNVWEWCACDLRAYAESGSSDVSVDPIGSKELKASDLRAVRGGSWRFGARAARSAFRKAYQRDVRYSTLGFRFALKSMSQGRPEGAVSGPEPASKRRDAASTRKRGLFDWARKKP